MPWMYVCGSGKIVLACGWRSSLVCIDVFILFVLLKMSFGLMSARVSSLVSFFGITCLRYLENRNIGKPTLSAVFEW